MEATRDEIKIGFENILQIHNRTFEKWLASAQFQLYKYSLLRYHNARDVVHSLYVKFMDGERTWDKEKCPDFEQFFFKAIHSHVKNLAITQKMQVPLDDDRFMSAWNDRDTTEHMEEFMELCRNTLKADESLLQIFDAFSDGFANRDTARVLNLDIRDVLNAKKRIIRKLQPIHDAYFKESY